MNKKDYLKINGQNAEEICARIREESNEESRILLEKAYKEKERILLDAGKEADNKRAAILSAADKEIERMKERIFSTLNLEKKRIVLSEKDKFIDKVLSISAELAQKFQSDKSYPAFLKNAILEGLDIIDTPDAEVYYSYIDNDIMKNISIKGVDFKSSDFKEIGVIVQSKDGRLLFDNRFSARLKRVYEEVYMSLLKEAF